MAQIHNVTLELVRPGRPHNQLLSPLTPYMALCGEGSPVTFNIEFEHRQFLNRLERLRYHIPDGKGGVLKVPGHLREAELRELGEDMGKILARITSLNAELGRVRGRAPGEGLEFVHIRLVLSGSELSILPFELAVSPQSYPGEGLELGLQGSLPLVITREIRRSRPLPVSWGEKRDSKILFVSAQPGQMSVPLEAHAAALRKAMNRWIEWEVSRDEKKDGDDGKDRWSIEQPLEKVKKRLRVLPDASIESIYNLCAEENFTHVHILAHGAPFTEAGEHRFGLALCKTGRPGEMDVVSGKQLASALRAERKDGSARSEPLMVTLATCDSGQQDSVLIPGGSIAHDLHSAGIPWVLASQFPLTKKGSVELTRFLYPKLLRGDDPRQVLFELRQRLSMTAKGEHDWASLVTYASIKPDFEDQMSVYLQHQTIAALEVEMGKADGIVDLIRRTPDGEWAPDISKEEQDAIKPRVEEALQQTRKLLELWESRLSSGGSMGERMWRSKCLGMQGSTYKRMGILYAALKEKAKATKHLEQSLTAYQRGMDEWVTDESHLNWTACQYLALSAVLGGDKDKDTFGLCRKIAEHDVNSGNLETRAWAHATLAELALIGTHHGQSGARLSEKAVKENLQKMLDLVGKDSFHFKSTHRQFSRYENRWFLGKNVSKHVRELAEIARKAVNLLETGEWG